MYFTMQDFQLQHKTSADMQVFIRQLNPTYEDIIGRILRKIEPKTLHSTETEGPGGLSRGTASRAGARVPP